MSEMYFRVNPNEEEFSIDPGMITEVSVTEEAENGRANVELKEKLREITGEEPGIVSGAKTRRKKLVFDQEEDTVMEKIRNFSGDKGEVQS